MSSWLLTDDEWAALHGFLLPAVKAVTRRGRPRGLDDRSAAQACLYRHFHSCAVTRAFGWNNLPKELGVSPSTANRRFREWTANGAWTTFWDALLRHRARDAEPQRDRARTADASVMHSLIAELERAYDFFNARFFAGALPHDVVIAIERPPRRGRGAPAGYFCGGLWSKGDVKLGHLVVCTSSLGRGAAVALEVLLHEMVHLRNEQVGLPDCDPRNQYHNRHFRDVARLAGLETAERDARFGYGLSQLSERGLRSVRELRANEDVFAWSVDSDVRPKGSVA